MGRDARQIVRKYNEGSGEGADKEKLGSKTRRGLKTREEEEGAIVTIERNDGRNVVMRRKPLNRFA